MSVAVSIVHRVANASTPVRRSVIAVLVLATFITAYLAIEYTIADPELAAWWPPAAFAAKAGMLSRGRERWLVIPLLMLAAGAGNLFAERDPFVVFLLGVGHGVDVIVFATLFAPGGVAIRLASFSSAVRFIAVAVVGAAGSGMALAVVATVYVQRPFLESLGQFTAAHAAATLATLPLALVPLVDGRPLRAVELAVQCAALATLIVVVLWPGSDSPIAYALLIVFVWATLRFSLIVMAGQLLITSVAVILLTRAGGGPFAVVEGDPSSAVILVQFFVMVYGATALMIAGTRTDWFNLIRRLETQEEALRQGIIAPDAGIVILQLSEFEPRVISMNALARRALGADVPPWGIAELDRAVSEDRAARVTFERNGHVYEAVVATTSTGDGAQLLSIVVVDVTEREERERQARAVAEELRQVNEQKDDFISAVSHELRTPVTSIIGFSESLDDDRLPHDLAAAGEIISRNARRLADVIEDVLELSRLSALGGPMPEPTEVDLVRVATEAAADAEGLARSRSVQVDLAPETPHRLVIRSRERDLVRVCANLLSNAVKFSPDDSPVTVEVVPIDPHDGGGAMLRIIDRGMGIPAEYRELVWDRFARVPIEEHRRVPGTGLGLSIVKALLESRLGGSARLLDTPGGGTTVEVRLPAVAPPTEPSPDTVARTTTS